MPDPGMRDEPIAGTAGASARREFERRRTAREEKIRQRHGGYLRPPVLLVDGVWPRLLRRLSAPGPLDPDSLTELRRTLASALPPA